MKKFVRYILKTLRNPQFAWWVIHRNIVSTYNEKLGHNAGKKIASLNEPWTFNTTRLDKHIKNAWISDQPEPTIIVQMAKPEDRLHTAFYGQRWIYHLNDVVFDPMWEIITANGHVLIESIRGSNFSARVSATILARKKILRRSKNAKKTIGYPVTALPIGDSEMFGHFLLNALPKILRCQTKSQSPLTVLLPPGCAPFVKDALSAANICYKEVFNPVRCENYYLAASSYESTEDIYFSDIKNLREMYLKNLTTSVGLKHKVYATRIGSARGRIGDYEEQLCRELKAIGFIIFKPGERTFIEEVKLFKNTSVLVAPTGSGFYNCIWMDSNSLVVEIIDPGIKLDTESETVAIKAQLNYKCVDISNFSADSVKAASNILHFIQETVLNYNSQL